MVDINPHQGARRKLTEPNQDQREKDNSLFILSRILCSLSLETPPPAAAVVAHRRSPPPPPTVGRRPSPPTAAAVFFLCSWFSRFESLCLMFRVACHFITLTRKEGLSQAIHFLRSIGHTVTIDMPSSFKCLPLLRDASNNTIVWPDWEAGAGSNSEMEIKENSAVKKQDLVEHGVLQRCSGNGQRTGCRYPRLRTSVTVGRGPILARKPIIVCGSGRPILYVIMSPQSRRRGRGRNRGHDTWTSINQVYNQMIEFIQSVIQPNIRAHLSRDGKNGQMMGRVGPTTASSTLEILTIQYVSGDTCRDTVQLETAVSTISHEYLLEFTSEYDISEALHPELPGPEDRIVDFPKGKVGVYTKFFEFANFRLPLSQFLFDILGYYQIHLSQLSVIGAAKNNRFFWVDERVLSTIVDWLTSDPKDGMPAENTYSPEAVMILNTHHTPIQKQPEALLCLVGLSRGYYLGDEVYPTFLHDDDLDMDLFNLIRAPNPTKVKTGSRPRAAHEVPLLTVTANRVIEMEDPAAATDLSGVPSTIERSPLDFTNENPSQQSTGPEDQKAAAPKVPYPENVTTTGVAPEAGQAERVAATGPPVAKERRKRGHDGVDTNAPPQELGMGTTRPVTASQGAPVDVSDPDPLSFADPQSRPSADVTQSSKRAVAAGDPESENTSFTSMVGSSESIYRPKWGITNGCLLDAPEACQDLVDHIAPPGYFLELRHLHNDNFLKQHNVNLAQQVAMGSQLRLRFEQEAKLLKKFVAQVARRDKRIQARENEIKNLETLLEAETGMKKAAENKSAELNAELENMRARFSDLRVSNNRLSQQVSTLQEQVMGEEKLKAAFEEFKQYEDNRVEQCCAELDARLDALSIDFDEELYPHMLTVIAGRRWVIGRGLRLAVMKCGESTKLRKVFADVVSAGIAKGMSEGLKHGVEHEKTKLNLEAIEAYDPEAEAKYIEALHALKNLKYPLVDQLESLNDAPIDVIMASSHLESDTGDDAP
uniref:Transposase (Putative), gypsy type n=1 Tax=Tanacetum cinerariifolium TaxID=118510 RepID=A0A6L2PA34_TANCI|nr:hypothetical protein [Tanacetum cinerariifolium]